MYLHHPNIQVNGIQTPASDVNVRRMDAGKTSLGEVQELWINNAQQPCDCGRAETLLT